jgi:hypothetical protein
VHLLFEIPAVAAIAVNDPYPRWRRVGVLAAVEHHHLVILFPQGLDNPKADIPGAADN